MILLCGAIVGLNLAVGLFAPTTSFVDDEALLLEDFWRVAQGQLPGIDYHDPFGFGPALVLTGLWHAFGVHYDLFRVTTILFALAIALCGCFAAARCEAGRGPFGWAFAIALAFILSAPSVLGSPAQDIGLAEFYNRLILGGLAVLLVQVFAPISGRRWRDDLGGAAIAAVVLDLMFLVKISGAVLGVGLLVAGCLVPGRTSRRLSLLGGTLLAFGVLMLAEFALGGFTIGPVFREYAIAAAGRSRQSAFHVLQALSDVSLVVGVVLLAFFIASRPSRPVAAPLWPGLLVLGSFALVQTGLYLTDAGPPPAMAAVAAALVLMEFDPRPDMTRAPGTAQGWWSRFAPTRLAAVPVRDAVPYVLAAFVLFPQVKGTLAAAFLGISVASGANTPVLATAGTGMALPALAYDGERDSAAYVRSVQDGIDALKALDLGDRTIATLDYANPFPILFGTPPPKGFKGVWTWWNAGIDIPSSLDPTIDDAIGDACIAMVPAHPHYPEVAALLDPVRRELSTRFDLVYRDAFWSIYRLRTDDEARGACQIAISRPISTTLSGGSRK